jgi:hypothetical protein
LEQKSELGESIGGAAALLAGAMSHINVGDAVKKSWLRYGDDHWIRTASHEEERLDQAFASASANERCICPLRGGRYEARLSLSAADPNQEWAGELVARYEDKPSVLLAHSRWCFRLNDKWTPFGPADDEALELRMNALLRLQQISAAAAARQPTASDGSAASARAPASAQSNDAVAAFVAEMAFAGAPAPLLTREGFQVHLSGDGKGGVRAEVVRGEAASSWGLLPTFSSSSAISRGWAGPADAPLTTEEEKVYTVEGEEPVALVLVVHGIGEALWRREDNPFRKSSIEGSVDTLRSLAAKASLAAAPPGTHTPPPHPRRPLTAVTPHSCTPHVTSATRPFARCFASTPPLTLRPPSAHATRHATRHSSRVRWQARHPHASSSFRSHGTESLAVMTRPSVLSTPLPRSPSHPTRNCVSSQTR